jgi:hypothetical protein
MGRFYPSQTPGNETVRCESLAFMYLGTAFLTA